MVAPGKDQRIERVLNGLGFSRQDHNRSCTEFSGGWQMRIALARLLLSEPDLLLLDEPTNHLDLQAKRWLTGYLEQYEGTIVLVTHEEQLLEMIQVPEKSPVCRIRARLVAIKEPCKRALTTGDDAVHGNSRDPRQDAPLLPLWLQQVYGGAAGNVTLIEEPSWQMRLPDSLEGNLNSDKQ
jgi:hypothetical protein